MNTPTNNIGITDANTLGASATNINLYRCSPRETLRFTKRILDAGHVPFIQGSPGAGKSSMIRALAKTSRLKMIDHRVSSSAPEDFNGLPDLSGEKAVHKPFDFLPVEGDPLPKDENGKEMNGWLLYLSEFNTGLPMVTVAAYKLVLEREVGQKKLHPAVHIVCDGNNDDDQALTQELGTAMKTRVIWLEMYLDATKKDQVEDFMFDVAIPLGWDHRVIALLHAEPTMLNKFDPNNGEKTQAIPRTWEFLSDVSKGHPVVMEDAPLYVGCVGTDAGTKYTTFAELYAQVPRIEDIIANPMTADVPAEPGVQWATMSACSEAVNKTNIAPISDYLSSYPLQFRVLFWRLVQLGKPELRNTPEFRHAFTSVGRYLYGDD